MTDLSYKPEIMTSSPSSSTEQNGGQTEQINSDGKSLEHSIDVKRTFEPSADRRIIDNDDTNVVINISSSTASPIAAANTLQEKRTLRRACGCAFKYPPSSTIATTTKSMSKSMERLTTTPKKKKKQQRSNSCTPIQNNNRKPSLVDRTKQSRENNKTSKDTTTTTTTIVRRFNSENALNKQQRTNNDNQIDQLILIPEVYGQHKFQTTFLWEPRAVPSKYSTAVYIDLNSATKYYVEKISMDIRLVPCPYVESLGTLNRYKSTIEADVVQPSSAAVIETTVHLSPSPDHNKNNKCYNNRRINETLI